MLTGNGNRSPVNLGSGNRASVAAYQLRHHNDHPLLLLSTDTTTTNNNININNNLSGDDREGHFLFQRLSVILQRYNAVLLDGSFVQSDGLGAWTSSHSSMILTFCFKF